MKKNQPQKNQTKTYKNRLVFVVSENANDEGKILVKCYGSGLTMLADPKELE